MCHCLHYLSKIRTHNYLIDCVGFFPVYVSQDIRFPKCLLTAHLSDLSTEKVDLNALAFSKLCNCPEMGTNNTRVPDCTCDDRTPKASQLLQVRWKRVILDEGHNSAAFSTNAMEFLTNKLSSESRWIVTGTPTTNLLGLSLGQQESVDSDEMPVDTSLDSIAGVRRWDSSDREDVRRLRIMIAKFLKFAPFNDDAMVREYVVDPLFHEKGPVPGAISVLSQVMQVTMLRHRYIHLTSVTFVCFLTRPL